MRSRLTRLSHWAEFVLAWSFLKLFSSLKPATASRLGASIVQVIGRMLPVSRIADANLRLALPHLTATERRDIVRRAWGQLGATVAEFPHLSDLPKNPEGDGVGWTISGEEHLLAIQKNGGPIIFFSGHIGNWEMLPTIVARFGLAFSPFYREAANPLINNLITRLRLKAVGQKLPMFPKGARGARAAMLHLKNGGRLGVLGDQKMNDGISAQLFGHEAMTASATASFALKYKCPIIPGVITRLGPACLHLHVEPPILPESGQNRADDVQRLTQRLNDLLETWIRRHPDQWLLMHRRWPKSLYQESRTAPKDGVFT